ncbi:hypothetical protein HOLleu_38742 [Holothuria leucospilota]|uniref:Uncharacterized protein n=1 Tax=Holothuria leucospilota TaxID=206669 RepID=A0A9Q0YJ40_HOLLE|nr:hypothetical protein HOLleu_38742 [Holothuria leucospilota]
MDSSELTQREVEEDFEQSVLSELRDVKQRLAELTDKVKLVKRSSTRSQMEQLKQTVAESNSVIKLLAAGFNTTRTMMLSEFRSILHAIPRGDEDAMQEQLIAADEALRGAQQAHTESLSQVEALQKELSDAKGALQHAEMDVSESNNRQNELQRVLQATEEEFMKAQKDVSRLKSELIRVKAESSSQVKALQKELFDTKGTLQQAQTDISEGKDIQNELQKALQATKEEVVKAKEEVERLKLGEAKSQSSHAHSEKGQSENQVSSSLLTPIITLFCQMKASNIQY